MKKYILPLLLVLVVGLSAPLAFSQNTTSVRGVCKDVDGKPITGAEVEWYGVETGHKYILKTNNKGEYFSLGIVPGRYNITLRKDGKEIYHFNGVTITLDEETLDFDLKKEQALQATGQGKSAEQIAAENAQKEKQTKEANTVGTLNTKIKEATAASATGDFEKAIATLTEANAIDSTRYQIWGSLGDAYRFSAPKLTDRDEKNKRYEMAAVDYQRAIDLNKASDQAQKDPENNKRLAAYYNNLGDAYSKELPAKVDQAIANYDLAAQLDPTHAGNYFYNEGAVLTNSGKADEALVAFDKAIAADPTKAMAYYQKGINLIGKETLGKDNKPVDPPGTAEAFQKYLELEPNGSMAENAKAMLDHIGTTVETGFGTKKKPAKK